LRFPESSCNEPPARNGSENDQPRIANERTIEAMNQTRDLGLDARFLIGLLFSDTEKNPFSQSPRMLIGLFGRSAAVLYLVKMVGRLFAISSKIETN